jgi:hypothetical protein
MLSRGFHPRLNRVVALIALLLAVAWMPMTSHELLKAAGWIHQGSLDGDHDDHDHGPAHEAADGIARLHNGGTFLKAPTFSPLGLIVAFAVALSLSRLLGMCRAELPLQRATESPPGLIRTWQFVLRMALPSRAPSFAV